MARVITHRTTLPDDIRKWLHNQDVKNPDELLKDPTSRLLISAVVHAKNPDFTLEYDMSPKMTLLKAYSLMALTLSTVNYIVDIDANPISEEELEAIAPVPYPTPNVRWYYVWYANPQFDYYNDNVPNKIFQHTRKYNNLVFWQVTENPPGMTLRFCA